MSEWLDNQNQSSSNIRQLYQERIEKANSRRQLTAKKTKRLSKLEAKRQLNMWFTEDEYARIEAEW